MKWQKLADGRTCTWQILETIDPFNMTTPFFPDLSTLAKWKVFPDLPGRSNRCFNCHL